MDITDLKEQIDYVEHLSKDVKDTILWYTGESGYLQFNKELRECKDVSQRFEHHLKNLTTAFEHVPSIKSSILLYKGIQSQVVYSDKAFMSTSTSYREAKEFISNSCCVMVITVTSGSKLLPISSISEHEDENEVLLDREGIIKLTNIVKNNDETTLLHMVYYPKNAINIDTKSDPSFEKNYQEIVINDVLISLEKKFIKTKGKDTVKLEKEALSHYKKLTDKEPSDVYQSKIKQKIVYLLLNKK